MHSRVIAALFAVVFAVALVSAATAGGGRKLTLTLDWTPNPDHVGFYYAQSSGLFAKAGIDLSITAPSDPTAPLKLVAAGRSDLAVSYEQELFFAAAQKLPVIAVAAVVPQPLNSIIAIERGIDSIAALKGRTIGITGVPSDYAALDTALASAGLARTDVHIVNVGYNLLPALLAHKVDAVIGVYRNVEGVQLQERGLMPWIVTLDRVGIPSYDELVLVANAKRLAHDSAYRANVRRAVLAFVVGTAEARRHPARAIEVLEKVTASDKRFLSRAVPATLALLAGRDGIGCMRTSSWQRFGAWMHARSLLKTAIPAAAVMTTRYLPKRCSASR